MNQGTNGDKVKVNENVKQTPGLRVCMWLVCQGYRQGWVVGWLVGWMAGWMSARTRTTWFTAYLSHVPRDVRSNCKWVRHVTVRHLRFIQFARKASCKHLSHPSRSSSSPHFSLLCDGVLVKQKRSLWLRPALRESSPGERCATQSSLSAIHFILQMEIGGGECGRRSWRVLPTSQPALHPLHPTWTCQSHCYEQKLWVPCVRAIYRSCRIPEGRNEHVHTG